MARLLNVENAMCAQVPAVKFKPWFSHNAAKHATTRPL